ncbi:DUF934 domain-containing protein [Reinekea blandensis]|uniref:Oxidoreductase probably involved in sulfite reduction n=1 Tax=Reinekea blandensis MED297 TaxID=314283 RepID=A4BHI7_9GAMM|nr:DUF934 domain-containing protein [Reinekea blandensis]EAR08385.1 hypothetical protein MED297_16634 [Reinekea blandensis MED297]
MQPLIKNGLLVENDPWAVFEAGEDGAFPEYALLPLSFWVSQGDEIRDSVFKLGAVLRAGDEIDALIPYLPQLKVIAFEFEKFADGRAFSFARQLRSEHAFTGEIRAFGDILPDQVNYLQRSGFDAFVLRSEQEAETALALGNTFSVQYQSDAVQSQPLFRRRVS